MVFAAPHVCGAQEIVCPKSSTNPDKNKEEGRRYFSMGITAFNMKQYQRSVASFTCVIALVPYSSKARFWLALGYKHLKKYEKALENFNWVLADVSTEAKPLKKQVAQHVQETLEILKKVKSAARDKADAQRKAEAERKRLLAVTMREAAKSKQTETSGMTSQWWFWAGVGATAVFTLATAGLGITTLVVKGKYDDDHSDDTKNSLFLYRTLTDVSLGAALISGALLVYGIFTNTDRASTPARRDTVSVLPLCSGSGCGISFTWSY